MDPAVLDHILSGIPRSSDPNLLVGYDSRDDAAVYRLPSGEMIVQTLDFFTPVVDDPYDFGAIAAANSMSDVYAMNGLPLFALNICAFSKKLPADLWREVLRGGAEKAREGGIVVCGGHTIDDEEPKYGMVVTGLVKDGEIWSNEGAKPGDVLILTKPIGTGVITTAIKKGLRTEQEASEAIQYMKRLNGPAAKVMAAFEVHACTDITGNGLLGHAAEIAEGSKAALNIYVDSVPILPHAYDLAVADTFPGGSRANRIFLADVVTAEEGLDAALVWLMYDAQTSGGLLFAVAEKDAEKALAALVDSGIGCAAVIGEVVAGRGIKLCHKK